MQKDILGQKELESVKLNWDFAEPGLMNGRCEASGTCDSQPRHPKQQHQILFSADTQDAGELKMKCGNLRFKK